MKKKIGLLSLVVLLLYLQNSCGKVVSRKSVPGPNDKVYNVSVSSVVKREIPDILKIEGRFIPLNRLEIKSDFTGKVQALSVVEGQNVLSGDVLLKIEDEKLPFVLDRQRAELREAEAQFDLDSRLSATQAGGEGLEEEEEFEEEEEEEAISQEPSPLPEEEEEGFFEEETSTQRLARLRQRAALARRRARQRTATPTTPTQPEQENGEVVEARQILNQTKIDRIKTEIALTEKQIEGSTILATLDGFINKLNVSEGSMVKPLDLLMEIITIDPIDLSLKVPKGKIDKIDKKMETKVKVPDLRDQSFKGEISFIGAELDTDRNNIEIRVRVNNPELRIKVGMEGIAQMAIAKSSHQALLVPANAVIQRDGKSYVYLVQGQVARLQPVETGVSHEDLLEIKKGIQKSDRIVSSGISQLKGDQEFIKTGS